MSGIFVLILLAIALTILPKLIQPKNDSDHSRIINAEWMANNEKFHLISRWGA